MFMRAHVCVRLRITHADCHEISRECVVIATAQLDLAGLCAWLLASSIQLQLPTVGARSAAEDGARVPVGAPEGGVIHSIWQPTFVREGDRCLSCCFSRCG